MPNDGTTRRGVVKERPAKSPSRICNLAHLDKRTSGDTKGAGIWGDSLGAISHIKLSQDAFRGNPPVFLLPPVSLLVGFPDTSLPHSTPRRTPRRTKNTGRKHLHGWRFAGFWNRPRHFVHLQALSRRCLAWPNCQGPDGPWPYLPAA